ncbi:MAG TPA: class I SAM-dependent methyltransferase [Anaerolineae bacterium]|nr:class I SAM-dependent methyltransferase [Anaerolineae bacterium]
MKMKVGLSVKEFESVNCVICNDSNLRLIAKKGEFGWPTYVSICKDCGLVFLSPRWTNKDYQRFYINEYDQVLRADTAKVEEKEKRKAKIVWQRLQGHLSDKRIKVLDIGCGMGWALQLIKQEIPGAELYAIEPSERYKKHVQEDVGAQIIATDVDSDWFLKYDDQFDLIIMRHVIEHLLDPVAALKKISHALSPKGLLYIATPDMMHPDGSLNQFWYRSVHTYYYSKVPMQRIAAKAMLEHLVLRTEKAELWGIFRKNPQVTEVNHSVYQEQMTVLKQYKIRRLVRWIIRLFAPQKISKRIPKSWKAIVPKEIKDKFRSLVYRH